MQEKSWNLSGKKGEESMIWDKMSCINGWMVKSNLVISLVPIWNDVDSQVEFDAVNFTEIM